MEHKARISVTLDRDLLDRIDDAARAIGASRSFAVSLLARGGLERNAGGGVASSPSRHPAAAIIEINPEAHVNHVAIASDIATAATLARDRGMRWAAGGSPAAVASMMPPIEATASICETIEHASILATAPAWARCRPQLTRTGHRA
ncbi:ribbon-helix-helix protein, CopG family [Acidiphilium acidophilum]|uniref:ribbon-helix-helix protein, CopG family n=1 Tax=Acidiphilium acidophilum TaxID=76588 RepID=UPI002E8E6993|nr:ribbon-helix-helix protein, CopG family [Acidiphilium acidophilum]